MQREKYDDFRFISFYGKDRRLDTAAIEACRPFISPKKYQQAQKEAAQ
jgi:hypothetical protein